MGLPFMILSLKRAQALPKNEVILDDDPWVEETDSNNTYD